MIGRLFLLFVTVPFVELWLLLRVAESLGAAGTIALVVVTAMLGSALVQNQGLKTLARLNQELAAAKMPGVTLIEGALVLAAGLLMLTPGIVTDAIGFMLLISPLRRRVAAVLEARFKGSLAGRVQVFGGGAGLGSRPASAHGSAPGASAPGRAGEVIVEPRSVTPHGDAESREEPERSER